MFMCLYECPHVCVCVCVCVLADEKRVLTDGETARGFGFRFKLEDNYR